MSARIPPPLSPAERLAVRIAGGAVAGFGAYGLLTRSPSTTGYVLSIVLVGLVVRHFRTEPLDSRLAIALAVSAAVHLAGGLVRVGGDVLYNASVGPRIASLHTHLLQYDHVAHAYSSGVAMLTIWTLIVRPMLPAALDDRGRRVAACVLAGLGVGAINETVEFLTTLAHHGAHVGGYTNTGWDLVANTIGVVAAATFMMRRSAPVIVDVAR